MTTAKRILRLASLLGLFLARILPAQTTTFTDQGLPAESGARLDGTADFKFRLYDDAVGGMQQCATLNRYDVGVSTGLFTVPLDVAPNVSASDARFIAMAVRLGE